MLQDVIERFRYRFQLWRGEQREDSMLEAHRPICRESRVSRGQRIHGGQSLRNIVLS